MTAREPKTGGGLFSRLRERGVLRPEADAKASAY
jgi:hypothetical protein